MEDALCYKYMLLISLMETLFSFFPLGLKLVQHFPGFSSSVSVPLVIVRSVSQRRASAQREKAPVQYFQSLLSL